MWIAFAVAVVIAALIFWPREPKATKCERLGHIEQKQSRRVMRKAAWDERYAVAVSVREERSACARCGVQLSEPVEASAKTINSWSAPSHIMDEFDEKGRWVETQWAA